MSHVLLAEDIRLGRRVALKQMNASADSDALLRLRREALIGASVSHRNLVSIYDIVAAGALPSGRLAGRACRGGGSAQPSDGCRSGRSPAVSHRAHGTSA